MLMRRADVLDRLRTVEPALRAHGIGGLYLFGSLSRDEGSPTSDIDLFIDAAGEDFYDLKNFAGAYRCISDVFPGVQIGYSTRESLSKYVRKTAEREAIKVF
jgi:predicted nucleotidyltransferase